MLDRNSDNSPMGIRTATQAADRLFGFFPRSAASDPQVFMAGVVELLAGYPAWVADRILSPKHGLPAHHTFLPSIKEIRERCEDEFKAHRYAREFDQTSDALRLKYSAPQLEGPAPPPRPTYTELKARYGPKWGITDPNHEKRAAVYLSAAELRAKYGSAFDLCPDQPEDFGLKRLKHLKAPDLR
jgi:hypothetical protein